MRRKSGGRAHIASQDGNRPEGQQPACAADLHRALQELDDAARELQRQVALDDGSDGARISMAKIRHTIPTRVDAILTQIAPAIPGCEYHQPGVTSRLHEIWFDRPDVRQDETVWLRFLGEVHRLLLDAVAGDPGTPSSTVATSAGKVNGSPTTRGAGMEAAEPERGASVQPKTVANTGRRLVQARLLDVPGAANYLGRTEEAVQHMIAQGKIKRVRIDRRVFIDVQDLDRLIDESKA